MKKKTVSSPKNTAPDFDALVDSVEWVRGLQWKHVAEGVAFTGEDNQVLAHVVIKRGQPLRIMPMTFGQAADLMKRGLELEYKGGGSVVATFDGWNKWLHQIAWRLHTVTEQLPHVENGNPRADGLVLNGVLAKQITERAERAGLSTDQFIRSTLDWKSTSDLGRFYADSEDVSPLTAAHLSDGQIQFLASSLRRQAAAWTKIVSDRRKRMKQSRN